MFYECEDFDIENNADGTIIYICIPDNDAVISNYSSHSDKLFTWFKYNHMKANPEKCHLFLST